MMPNPSQILASLSLYQAEPTIECIRTLVMDNVLTPLSRLAPVFSKAALYVTVEANHNWTIAGFIASVVRDNVTDGRRVSFAEQTTFSSAKVGFVTTRASKEAGVSILTSLFGSNAVFFDESFFGHKQWLQDQILRFRKVIKSSTLDSGTKFIMTAKTKSHNQIDGQDDQMMALIIAIVQAHEWIDTVRGTKRLRTQ